METVRALRPVIERFHATYAGRYWDGSAGALVILLTHGAGGGTRRAFTEAAAGVPGSVPLQFRPAVHSLELLEANADRIGTAVAAAMPGVVGWGVDERSNRVQVNVLRANVPQATALVARDFGSLAVVQEVAEPPRRR